MNDELRLGRAARAWLEDGPTLAPADVVDAALFEIDTTPQERDQQISWRLPPMPTVARFAAAAAAIVVVAGGTTLLIEANNGPAAGRLSPGLAAATAAPAGTATPTDALTSTFTSARYGYSLAVSPTWSTLPATLTWTGPDNSGDVVDQITIDPALPSSGVQLNGASQPMSPGQTFAAWLAAFQPPRLAADACLGGPAELWPVRQVGGRAWTWQQMCYGAAAIAAAGDRVYVFTCIGCFDMTDATTSRFDEVLASARLDPAAAAPPPAAPALSETFASKRNGYSIRYPSDWAVIRAASAPASATTLPRPTEASVDAIGTATEQLSVTSVKLPAGTSPTAWAETFCAGSATAWSPPCSTAPASWPRVAIGDTSGWLVVDGDSAGLVPLDGSRISRLFVATVVAGGRAYEIRLDGPVEHSLFTALLASMQLDPASATAAAPAP